MNSIARIPSDYQPLQMVDGAGFWLRLIAHIIDGIIAPTFAFVIACIGIIPFILIKTIFPDLPNWLDSIVAGLFILWLLTFCFSGLIYFAWFESSPLQATPGKLALGLMVTDLSGKRISFQRALGRNSAKFFSYLTCYIGFLLAAFTDKKQALHDMMSLALVVRKPKCR